MAKECKVSKKWIDLEMEHTKSPKTAAKIVNDHIKEFGCSYYPELINMENKIKNKNKLNEVLHGI